MKIILKKRFVKQYRKLKLIDQIKVDAAIRRFWANPADPILRNHALAGKLLNMRSISAGFDLRLVFEVKGDYSVVMMLAVGSHNQVY
jgi:addiction module RelE/StbE family toxin